MTETERPYEAPSIVEIGTLHELTLGKKEFGEPDLLHLIPIAGVS